MLAINSKDTSYNPKQKTFVTMASDIGLRAGQWPHRIRMTSEWTGGEREFKMAFKSFDREQELTEVWYESGDLKLEIFND